MYIKKLVYSVHEPKNAGFTIGDFSKQNPEYINNNKVEESAEYSIGDDIPFTAGIQMDRHLYGNWKEEKSRLKKWRISGMRIL